MRGLLRSKDDLVCFNYLKPTGYEQAASFDLYSGHISESWVIGQINKLIEEFESVVELSLCLPILQQDKDKDMDNNGNITNSWYTMCSTENESWGIMFFFLLLFTFNHAGSSRQCESWFCENYFFYILYLVCPLMVVCFSLGAILGFMLGVYHIPLSECEVLYRKLGSDVFKQNVIVGTMKMGWNHAFYDCEVWEKVLKWVVSVSFCKTKTSD